jgi:hypothetical protein
MVATQYTRERHPFDGTVRLHSPTTPKESWRNVDFDTPLTAFCEGSVVVVCWSGIGSLSPFGACTHCRRAYVSYAHGRRYFSLASQPISVCGSTNFKLAEGRILAGVSHDNFFCQPNISLHTVTPQMSDFGILTFSRKFICNIAEIPLSQIPFIRPRTIFS